MQERSHPARITMHEEIAQDFEIIKEIEMSRLGRS